MCVHVLLACPGLRSHSGSSRLCTGPCHWLAEPCGRHPPTFPTPGADRPRAGWLLGPLWALPMKKATKRKVPLGLQHPTVEFLSDTQACILMVERRHIQLWVPTHCGHSQDRHRQDSDVVLAKSPRQGLGDALSPKHLLESCANSAFWQLLPLLGAPPPPPASSQGATGQLDSVAFLEGRRAKASPWWGLTPTPTPDSPLCLQLLKDGLGRAWVWFS